MARRICVARPPAGATTAASRRPPAHRAGPCFPTAADQSPSSEARPGLPRTKGAGNDPTDTSRPSRFRPHSICRTYLERLPRRCASAVQCRAKPRRSAAADDHGYRARPAISGYSRGGRGSLDRRHRLQRGAPIGGGAVGPNGPLRRRLRRTACPVRKGAPSPSATTATTSPEWSTRCVCGSPPKQMRRSAAS